MGQFEIEIVSPASASFSATSALNICQGFFNAEDTEEDAEFAEKTYETTGDFKVTH
ncbi:hypothetical protein BH10ACI2_BH10ACI2_06750 [soil metagenome]